MSAKDKQLTDLPGDDRIAGLSNVRVRNWGYEGINTIEESNGRTVLINSNGHNGNATIIKKASAKEASEVYEITSLVSIPDKFRIQEDKYISYSDTKKVPFDIELASDTEVTEFIDKDRLLKFVDNNGIICNDINTAKIYEDINKDKTNDDTYALQQVTGFQYDYVKLCIKILLLYSSMQLLTACSNARVFGDVKKVQVLNALGLFLYFDCKIRGLLYGDMCYLLHSYYVDKTLEDVIKLATFEAFYVHSKELKRIPMIFDEQNIDVNLIADDWFCYCSYELILLWKFVKTGATLKQCANPNCGATFPPLEHGNERYCPSCINRRRQITYDPGKRRDQYEAKKMGIPLNEYRAKMAVKATNIAKEGELNGADN